MKLWEYAWLQCSGCQETARLLYGDRCANCGPDTSDCPHDMWDTDSEWNDVTQTLIITITCQFCNSTTSIDVGDLSKRKWELPK